MESNHQEKSVISKSQKKHRKKVEKRKAKKEERKIKQAKEQEESGKLIEENHNGSLYSPQHTKEQAERRIMELLDALQCLDNLRLLLYFRQNKSKYLTIVLKWSDMLERGKEFYFLKRLLEEYWTGLMAEDEDEILGMRLRNYIRREI